MHGRHCKAHMYFVEVKPDRNTCLTHTQDHAHMQCACSECSRTIAAEQMQDILAVSRSRALPQVVAEQMKLNTLKHSKLLLAI
jgi:hypothetical protein